LTIQEKAMQESVRRVVTGHDEEGKAIFISDGTPARHVTFDNLPELEFFELWATEGVPQIPVDNFDPSVDIESFVPSATGTRFRIVRFPSGLEMAKLIEKGFDPAAFRNEYRSKIPGLAETHEVEDPSMHETATIDYGIVLSGEIDLELDEGKEVHLKAGDCIVQNGTRHGWRNRSSEACVIAFIMIGAERAR
jgi:mannose-6-phosphate isomerase-like protein (cupin superfamily)